MESQFWNEVGEVRVDPVTGVATWTLAMPGGVNKVDDTFGRGFSRVVAALRAAPEIRGLVIVSGHRDWCVGADLDLVFRAHDPAALFAMVTGLSAGFRALETAGKPVVALLNGSALGGGFELALACHHRIVLGDPRIQLGLPEVMLGLIPGAGGTQRLPRLIGIQAALELMAAGDRVRPEVARSKGMVDAVAPDLEAGFAAAVAWIGANKAPKQPWDRGGFTFPGGVTPQTVEAMNLYTAAAAMLYQKTAGSLRAPEVLLQVVQEGCRLTLDGGLGVEARAFAALATSSQAKDLIRTLWYHKNAADKREGLPSAPTDRFRKIVVLGAGMMGAGLAFLCAKAGYSVVLRDISAAALDAGLAHVRAEAKKLKHLGAAEQMEIVQRISATLDLAAVDGADLVIEAVVEDLAVKHAVIREVEPRLAPDAVFASNTSALPISDLAAASAHPDRFIGLHYFSPVEKMALVEIIRGRSTSDETLARCLAFSRALKKTPIVVNDGYAFYTTRLFSAYTLEGVQMVAEGHDPRVVEWAARTAGMVVGPLQVFDEVTLTLGLKAMVEAEKYGFHAAHLPGVSLLRVLVDEHGRRGRASGAGFYDYAAGRRLGIWAGIRALTPPAPERTGIDLLRHRLMSAQAAEVGRILDDGVLQRWRDAEVGAVFGLGFAPNTGGPLTWMARRGLPVLVRELDEAAGAWGPRYAPSATLRRMAAEKLTFWDDIPVADPG